MTTARGLHRITGFEGLNAKRDHWLPLSRVEAMTHHEFVCHIKMLAEQTANSMGNAENAIREIAQAARDRLGIKDA